MAFTLTQRDHERLEGAHPDLRRVIIRAASMSPIPFTVLEVLRSIERQKKLVATGASKTMKSRHLPHPTDKKSRAADVAPLIDGQVSWDWPLYHKLAAVIKEAAKDESVAIEWGGDWRTFKDGPHWQLPWAQYP